MERAHDSCPASITAAGMAGSRAQPHRGRVSAEGVPATGEHEDANVVVSLHLGLVLDELLEHAEGDCVEPFGPVEDGECDAGLRVLQGERQVHGHPLS